MLHRSAGRTLGRGLRGRGRGAQQRRECAPHIEPATSGHQALQRWNLVHGTEQRIPAGTGQCEEAGAAALMSQHRLLVVQCGMYGLHSEQAGIQVAYK